MNRTRASFGRRPFFLFLKLRQNPRLTQNRKTIAMQYRNLLACRSLAVMIGPALFIVLGCSQDDGLGKRYGVSGTVTYNGQPVAKGRINFIPKDKGARGASGQIENGSFSSLTTLSTGDGALPGEYTVAIDTKEIDEAAAKAETEKLAKKHGMSNLAQMPPELQAKMAKQAKSSIPKKYENPENSKLTAKVEEHSNSFEFKLTD
jgi:hypothetical protein